MKLTLTQLSQHLCKTIAPLYVISGDEPLLIQEAIDNIRRAAYEAGFSERVRLPIETGVDLAKILYTHTQTLSLFAEKRLLELDLTTIKLNATSSKTLQHYAQQPAENIILLIRTHKLDSKSEKSSWYQALNKVGMMIPVWPITLEQLPGWILQRAKKHELTLTPSAAQRLAGLVEGNLLAAAQEIEKLALLGMTEIIDHNVIENSITDLGQFDIFILVDSAIAGTHSRTLRILDHLAAEDIEPTLILWALTRELRTLAELALQMQQGIALHSLFTQFRIFEKRQAGVRAFLQRYQKEHCWTLLAKSAEIDRIIKGAEKGNVWNSLRQFVIDFSSPLKELS